MSACQLGKGRNCREGVAHKQGNWRIFEQPETYSQATGPFAGKPAPTAPHCLKASEKPVGAGAPANGPEQGEDQRLA